MYHDLVLWHIEISHYSEKARWALDHKAVDHVRRTPVPGAHMAIALWLTRGCQYTFPVLQIDCRATGDSTALIAALEESFPDPPLYPADPAQRHRALELEDFFDQELAPHMRLLGFHELHADPDRFDELAAATAPATMGSLGRFAGLYGRAFTAVRFGVRNRDAAELARTRIAAALDRLEAELDESDYLVGDQFSVADLTAAALFYPLVLPAEGPLEAGSMPEGFVSFRDRFSERPGFHWVQEMFRRHRHRAAQPLRVGAQS